jgi:cytochrome P450
MSTTPSAMEASIAMNYRMIELAFGAPELAAARATAEPQRMYAELTASQPVRELGERMYSILRLDDILFLNKHPTVEQGSKYLGSDRPAIPLGLDGAEHRKYRRLLDPVFGVNRVAVLAPAVRELALALIDEFVADGRVDAYHVWCEPLPSRIFLAIMGLPMDDLENFLHFKRLTLGNDADADTSIEGRVARRAEAVIWIHNYFNAELDRREGAPPKDDMIAGLLAAEVDGHRLGREEMLDILGLLMIAGLDTVAASLACFLSYFARHPEHRQVVVDDPAMMRPAIEELMRFECPVVEGNRIATEEITLPSGYTIPAASDLHISWSAANLDPETFPNPLEVDFHRSPNPHIGFASGWHRCLGSHLARMEMDVALNAWHERIPNYRVADGVELYYTGNPRAPHALPLVW